MTYEEYDLFCDSLPATSNVVQWGNASVWKVAGKVFAIGGWETSNAPAISFKVSEHNWQILKEQPGFRPAPYMASRGMKWIQAEDVPNKDMEEMQYYISESHRIVSLGLTKKKQKELALNQSEKP